MMPDKMKLVVIPQTGKQFRAVKALLFRKDVGSVVIATDAGREGELVARWILEITGCLLYTSHASYAIFEPGEFVDRDKLEPKHFAKWVEFAKERGLGLDFNPTCFAHPKVKDNLTLSSPDEETRQFWIQMCIRDSFYSSFISFIVFPDVVTDNEGF